MGNSKCGIPISQIEDTHDDHVSQPLSFVKNRVHESRSGIIPAWSDQCRGDWCVLSDFSHLSKNSLTDCLKELYSLLSPYLKDLEAQRCASFGRWVPIPTTQSNKHLHSQCKYKSHQKEHQARELCYSEKFKLYLSCLWWKARQHHGYSPRD